MASLWPRWMPSGVRGSVAAAGWQTGEGGDELQVCTLKSLPPLPMTPTPTPVALENFDLPQPREGMQMPEIL